MSGRLPSLTALLGLLAVAGFQNRDKIAEMLGAAQNGQRGAGGTSGAGGFQSGGAGSSGGGGLGGFGNLGGLFGGLGGSSVGGFLGGGLNELIESFQRAGQGDVADSWVSPGPNKPVAPEHLEKAIDPQILAALSQQTGLSREELLSRLSATLPEAVDKLTPDGRVPDATLDNQTGSSAMPSGSGSTAGTGATEVRTSVPSGVTAPASKPIG